MKKAAILISIFLLAIPVVALAKSRNKAGSKPESQEQVARADKSCKAELALVGEVNFKELYGRGDNRTGAMSQCQKIKKDPPRRRKRDKGQNGQVQDDQGQHRNHGQNGYRGHPGKHGQRVGPPPGGPLGGCLKDRGVGRDSSLKDKVAAVKKCEADLDKKRGQIESKRLEVLKSCVDEQADDSPAFNSKYAKVGEENQAEMKQRLEKHKAKLEEAGKSTKRLDRELKRLETIDVRPFRACDRSNMQKLIEKERGSKGNGDGPPGFEGGPGGPGPQGPAYSGDPEGPGSDGFGGPPPEEGQI